jgi:predicted lipoprotein
MSRHHVHGQSLAAVLALALSLGLGACGKENRPSAPEGEESRYIYPQVYPKPSSVLPQGEEEAPKTGEVPTHVGGIGVFPTNTRRETIYDSGPIQ